MNRRERTMGEPIGGGSNEMAPEERVRPRLREWRAAVGIGRSGVAASTEPHMPARAGRDWNTILVESIGMPAGTPLSLGLFAGGRLGRSTLSMFGGFLSA